MTITSVTGQSSTNTLVGSIYPVNGEIWYVDAETNMNLKSDKTRGGWLQALDKNGAFIDLCENTKLASLGTINGRCWFTVQDGPLKGQDISIKQPDVMLHIKKQGPEQTLATVTVTYSIAGNPETIYSQGQQGDYDQYIAEVSCDGKKFFASLLSVSRYSVPGYTVIPAGTYNILVPDYSHPLEYTEFYRRLVSNEIMFDQVWFPIELDDNSRYIHLGNVSEGCVTIMGTARGTAIVTDYSVTPPITSAKQIVAGLQNWTDVYKYLIAHRDPKNKDRKGNKQYVGTITVTYI